MGVSNRVLGNLVSNAQRYARRTICIRVYRVATSPGKTDVGLRLGLEYARRNRRTKKPRRGQKVPSSAATSLTGPTHTNT